jgi:hypothetical protein
MMTRCPICLQAGTAPHVREQMIEKAVNEYGKLPRDPTVKVLLQYHGYPWSS